MHAELDKLLQENFVTLQRYVNYKVNNRHDAEDIIQDTCLSVTVKFDTLKNPALFKAWLIGIANHKINDYYRRKAKICQISADALPESVFGVSRLGITEYSIVRNTMEILGDKEKQILYLYYFMNLSQKDISKQLSVPIGTVKSRLHYAKEKFKQQYPHPPILKGENTMNKFPKTMPEYKIEKTDATPFAIIHEELPGMFIIPRIGEKIAFVMYDFPLRNQSGFYQLSVTGQIQLHGLKGVTIEKEYRDCSSSVPQRSTVFAQLTDTHCKYLGGMHLNENGDQHIITFLDSDFDDHFGIGEDNCGFPTYRIAEGKIIQTLEGLSMPVGNDISDIVGRFKITFNRKVYDTVRLIDYQINSLGGMLCEYYIDENGRTVLWRRFNKNDWANKRYEKLWTEMLPDNQTLMVNGETYVHWYDCITDYIL